MFEIYALMTEKPFTLDIITQEELSWDLFYSKMSPEQREFYLRAAREIGAREAARYTGQDVRTIAEQQGVAICEEQGNDHPAGSGPYAIYCASTRKIIVCDGGARYVARHLAERMTHAREAITSFQQVMDIARELLIAHELFHHLEATSLGPAHRMLPPMSLSVVGDFWKIKRYVKRTREIAAHSFAFTLLRIEERFPVFYRPSVSER